MLSFVASSFAGLFSPLASAFSPSAPASRVGKKQRVSTPEAITSGVEEEMLRRLEEAEAFHICPNTERTSMKVTGRD